MAGNVSKLTSVSEWIEASHGVSLEQETIQDTMELSKVVQRLIFHTDIHPDINDEPNSFIVILQDLAFENLKDE